MLISEVWVCLVPAFSPAMMRQNYQRPFRSEGIATLYCGFASAAVAPIDNGLIIQATRTDVRAQRWCQRFGGNPTDGPTRAMIGIAESGSA